MAKFDLQFVKLLLVMLPLYLAVLFIGILVLGHFDTLG
jgi:hypothetical protein